MATCGKKGKDKGQVQKVVIPKGMINPGETTIIEIPSALQKQPIVVAKRKTSIDDFAATVKKCCGKKSKNKEMQNGKLQYEMKGSGKQPADLDATERKEREQFLKDLEEFQRARRKLLSNASFLAGEKSKNK